MDRPDIYPLSHNQRSLWFLRGLAPDSAAYNVGFPVRIRSRVDIPALRQAFQDLMARHPALRTTFPARGSDLVQAVHQSRPLCFEQVDASRWEWRELTANVSAAYKQPFDLEAGPVLRVYLYTRAENDHILLLVLHHIVCDGWSLWLLLDELRVLYQARQQGTPATLPACGPSYKDFVHWQNGILASSKGERLWAYWQSRLTGELPVLKLPTDRPRPLFQTFNGASHPFKLTEGLTESLRRLSQAEKTTLYTTLAAAFQILLHRYTDQEEILLGSLMTGRSRPDFAGIVGDFVNPVVLRGSMTGNPGFKAFLAQMRRTVLEALLHQDFPFSVLVERLRMDPDPSRSPLFQVLFNFLKPQRFQEVVELWVGDESGKQVEWGGLALEPFSMSQQEGQMDLTLEMIEGPTALFGVFKYNSDLFNAATIGRMAGQFRTLLESIATHPDRRISDLSLLTEREKRRLLVEWNETRAPYPRDKCVHQWIENQCHETPEAVAAIFEDRQLTYRELNEKANRLAHHLRKQGVRPGLCVAVCMERSLDLIVALLGILKAGAAYLPLEPRYPLERVGFMLADARISVLLTSDGLLEEVGSRLDGGDHSIQRISLDEHRESIARESAADLANSTAPSDLAYVIYTSGSTGRPKGVAIEHRNTVALLSWAHSAFSQEELAGVLASTSICFDLSVFEIFAPLTCGGTIILAENALALAAISTASRVSLINTVPSALPELLRLRAIPSSVKVINLAGEPLRAELVRQIYESTCVRKVCDLYGPSECTSYSTWACRSADGPQTIGRPIANTRIYILDAHRNPVPIGAAGEIFIGGEGIARGYLNRPELTAERFIHHSFDDNGFQRLYRTGDFARYLPDGNIELLGRLDNQVKIRGYRIELGEIEAVLAQHPAVGETAVIARETGPGDRELAAYVVSNEAAPAAGELRAFLKTKLPHYMIPSAVFFLDCLPLTANGKVDRRALAETDQSGATVARASTPPSNSVEEAIAGVWAEILGVKQIGVDDNFFDLGGQSLKATQVVSRLRDIFRSEISLRHLFEFPTIAELAAVIALSHAEPANDSDDANEQAEWTEIDPL